MSEINVRVTAKPRESGPPFSIVGIPVTEEWDPLVDAVADYHEKSGRGPTSYSFAIEGAEGHTTAEVVEVARQTFVGSLPESSYVQVKYAEAEGLPPGVRFAVSFPGLSTEEAIRICKSCADLLNKLDGVLVMVSSSYDCRGAIESALRESLVKFLAGR